MKIHNSFRIEVRDKETNALKTSARAENMVLNAWNLGSIPRDIYFGSGSDSQQENPDMTNMIEYLDSKSIESTSGTWSGDTFVVNYKAEQIAADEHVGKIIAEVGLYDSIYNNLLSHAFIKDSEGNPITIEKKATDVINLYATVYYKREYETYKTDSLEFVYPYTSTTSVSAHTLNGKIADMNSSLEIDEPKRKKGVLQISNSKLNGEEIRGFLFGSNYDKSLDRVVLFPSVLFPGERLSKLKLLGEQDGVNKKFNLPWDCVKDFKLYKNGNLVPQSDYIFIKAAGNILKDLKSVEINGVLEEKCIRKLDDNYLIDYKKLFEMLLKSSKEDMMGLFYEKGVMKNLSSYTVEFENPYKVSHYKVSSSSSERIKVELFTDSWVEIYNDTGGTYKTELSSPLEGVRKARVSMVNPNNGSPFKSVPWLYLSNDEAFHLEFNNAPLSTDSLEFDGFVDYIPKDKDHVINLSFDFSMSAGG